AFQRDELPVPVELQIAAEIALSNRCATAIATLEQSAGDPQALLNCVSELGAIATEANRLRCQLQIPEARITLEQLILRQLWQLLHENDPSVLEGDIERLVKLIEVSKQLRVGLSLARVQELYYHCLYETIVPSCFLDERQATCPCRWTPSQLCPLLGLGQELEIDVSPWLK
ncbi:MAG: glycoside hydrolase, partial [Hydrococcus sp. RU_2_2]|nr:glycoside hydrolase [Hydrococcus sp. RU_2_2]